MMKKLLFGFLLFFCFANVLLAQTGAIMGKVTDKTNASPLEGAIIQLEGTEIGTLSDGEGYFSINEVPVGKYKVIVSYVTYQKLEANAVEVRKDQSVILNFDMLPEASSGIEVNIVGTVSKQSVSSIITLQKQSATILTGISFEEIKRTPDRTTSDVLKRVSGTTIQDNKFVIIRGLSDRYNMALLNQSMLPSTEPDRRAFSFDIFPANLMDNLIIYKTASPDLPGEFAGGIIRLSTKEIPDSLTTNIALGVGYNTQSTFKSYHKAESGKWDWLGFDDGTRALPKDFPSAKVYDSLLTNPDTRFEASKLLPSHWGIFNKNSMPLSSNLQVSVGNTFKLGDTHKLGVIGALTYTLNNRRTYVERLSTLTLSDTAVNEKYADTTYRQNVMWGGLLNMLYEFSANHKLTFQNLYAVNSNNIFVDRGGVNISNDNYVKANYMQFVSNQVRSNQIGGEHSSKNEKIKLTWNVSNQGIIQKYPDFRKMLYIKNKTPQGALEDSVFSLQVPFGSASPDYGGRFDSELKETTWNGQSDIAIRYNALGEAKNTLKVGILGQTKNRQFDARIIGYAIANPSLFDWSIMQMPQDSVFTPAHIGNNGFKVDETTNPQDSYVGKSRLLAGYVMADQKFGQRFRASGGVRIESFYQALGVYTFNKDSLISMDTSYLDILPSANLSYALTEKSNLRFSASRTVSRPNLRELAPFSFYDPVTATALNGNDSLVRTQITNLDLRYEIFPGFNQLFAVSLFYKKFKNPIEQRLDGASGAGSLGYTFFNAPNARNLGVEIETRIKPLLSDWSQWQNFTIYGNFAYINSRINLSDSTFRPLQGQSPYIINAGINYFEPEKGWGITCSFNRIGRRIWLVGDEEVGATKRYYHLYENPRSVVDIQVSKRIFKNGELKLNANDVLNQALLFYEDRNGDRKYTPNSEDVKRIGTKFGSNYSLSFSYRF